MNDCDNSCCHDKRNNNGKYPAPASPKEEECSAQDSGTKDGPKEWTIDKAYGIKEVHSPQRQVPTPTTGPASSQEDNPA